MKSFFAIFITLLSLPFVSCVEKRQANQDGESVEEPEVEYLFDSNSNSYLKTEQTDSTMTIFVCNLGDSSFVRKVVKREKLSKTREALAILDSTTTIDSNRFYSSVYPVIEFKVFSLPGDRKILDQTWHNTGSKELVMNIDRIKIDAKRFTRMNTSSLGLKIKVNKKGKIVDAAYYSKVKDLDHLLIPIISDDLLILIIKELKTKSIPPYSLLGIPVDVEIPITVKIIDSVTVPSKTVVR
ncbi:hypothetical protein [Sphingobacterium sp. xlx-130]|uniref:hypothetical protein n=1 Tax=Sphingobacterium sp. xlx-130 TaxID=2654323 RepID=UPI0013DC4465|nr:hypothetical protein [Sphingobacterium sp. xlx-130]